MASTGSASLSDIETLALGVGAALALINATYRPLLPFVTAIHEAGHALAAFLSGRKVTAITIRRDTSGETVSTGRSRGVGVVLTLLCGYPSPSLLGLSAVWAARRGHVDGWALVTFLVLFVTLFALRNFYGVVIVAVLAAGLWWVVSNGQVESVVTGVVGIGSFLMTAGLRGVWELVRERSANDATFLARASGVPVAVWKAVFVVFAVFSLSVAAWLVWPAGVAAIGG